MEIIDPVTQSGYHYLEYELNRLAGTLVQDLPTLGAATAALWWWGHRELNWAVENLLTPNQATGGSTLGTTEGFVGLNGETLDVVESEALIGAKRLRITASSTLPAEEPRDHAYLSLAESIPVVEYHIYTISGYVKAEQITDRRGNHLSFVWYNAAGETIGTTEGDLHSTKLEAWTHIWVTGPAPAGATSVDVILQFDHVMPGEIFAADKWVMHNSSDVQAWAFPGYAATNRALGLQAHLNMKAGIYNPDEFLTLADVAQLLGGSTRKEAPEDALARIPTPNPLVVDH